jgi:hypothetical protein
MTTVEVPVPANAVGSPINWREIASRAVVQAKFKAGRSAFAEDFAGRVLCDRNGLIAAVRPRPCGGPAQ